MNLKKIKLDAMSVDQLVERFAAITAAQDDAVLGNQSAKYNRLYGLMLEVTDELKGRPGDQRLALMKLYEYPNMQVQLQAARFTLAVAPLEARRKIEVIADSGWLPQAGDAGMSLWALDRGQYKPT